MERGIDKAWLEQFNKTFYVYTLTNPKTDEIFYVGVTQSCKWRKSTHASKITDNGKLSRKDRYVVENGITPVFEVIDEIVAYSLIKASEVEEYWIHQLRAWGFNLTNQRKSGIKYSKVF
jgi:3-oxoacyl-[acyl-carrier-protein] synthase III